MAIGGGVSALVSPIVGGALADEHGHLSTAGRTATALVSVTAGMGAATAAGKDHLAAAQNEVMTSGHEEGIASKFYTIIRDATSKQPLR